MAKRKQVRGPQIDVDPELETLAAGLAENGAFDVDGLVAIKAPAALFEASENGPALIWRRRRCAIWRLDQIKAATDPESLYKAVAYLIPKWANILDVETGDELEQPGDNPMVFERLDAYQQWPWVIEQLQTRPPEKTTRRYT